MEKVNSKESTREKPLISVITPVLNQEKNILSVLESVAGQTYSEVEHIIVDGASSDRTAGIVREFMETHPAVRLLSEPDTGVYDAMNKGLGMSAGDWIIFLGADDRFFSNTVLEELFLGGFFNEEQIVYGNVIVYGDTAWAKDGTIYDGPFDLKKLLIKNICHQCLFYPKSTKTRIGLYSDAFRISSDWDYNLRCFRLYPFVYTEKTIAYFGAGGISSAGFGLDEEEIYLNNVTRYFELDPFGKEVRNPESPFYYPMTRYRETEHVKKIDELLAENEQLKNSDETLVGKLHAKIDSLSREMEENRVAMSNEIAALHGEIDRMTAEYRREAALLKSEIDRYREEKDHLMLVIELNREDTRRIVARFEAETARLTAWIESMEREVQSHKETIAGRDMTIRVMLDSLTWKTGKFILAPLQLLLKIFRRFRQSI